MPIGILLVLITAGLAIIKFSFRGEGIENSGIKVKQGAVLPEFSLVQLDGKEVPFSGIPGKVFLINFWATWCDACMQEMPSIVTLRESFKDQGFEVLGVNLDETPETAVPKVTQSLKMRFPIFKDPEGQVADLFDVHAVPFTLIISKNRKVLMVHDGEKDWNSPEFRTQLKSWLTE